MTKSLIRFGTLVISIVPCILTSSCRTKQEIGLSHASPGVEPIEQSATYLPLRFKPFSHDALKESLDNKTKVLVVIRSNLSFWSPNWVNIKRFRQEQHEGSLVAFEMIWDWNEDNNDAMYFFDEFGFSKDAFLVLFDPLHNTVKKVELPLNKEQTQKLKVSAQ
ncbi:hypothetical protein Rhal01_03725 [Rubritalea halochordaticola]|uniref:Lipoprotein n=1 Tax=Rubritalea halochordaticola TaxID=714537 RepID=A0ABP9V6K9_9BACT